jgi:hypothetical protein
VRILEVGGIHEQKNSYGRSLVSLAAWMSVASPPGESLMLEDAR